jgi:hypothetical protein
VNMCAFVYKEKGEIKEKNFSMLERRNFFKWAFHNFKIHEFCTPESVFCKYDISIFNKETKNLSLIPSKK